jgi:hypothetical protein
MQSKEYKLPNGKTAVFEYDVYGIGKVTLESMDELMSMIADRPQGEWIFKPTFPNDKSEFPMGSLVCSVCGSHHSNSTPCNYCDNCGARMKGADDE